MTIEDKLREKYLKVTAQLEVLERAVREAEVHLHGAYEFSFVDTAKMPRRTIIDRMALKVQEARNGMKAALDEVGKIRRGDGN